MCIHVCVDMDTAYTHTDTDSQRSPGWPGTYYIDRVT